MSVFTSSGGQNTVVIEGATNPQIDNVLLATASTEYSIVFPVNTVRYLIKSRNPGLLLLRYISGGDYVTIPYGAFFSEDGIGASALTVYVESTSASQMLEIVTWS